MPGSGNIPKPAMPDGPGGVPESAMPDGPGGVPESAMLAAVAQAFSYPANGLGETLAPLRRWLSGKGDGCEAAGGVRTLMGSAGCFPDPTAEQLAYTRLFIGSLEMLAPPYASYYMSESHTLNGQAAVEVAAVYRQFGIRLADDEIAPPDHLRYMLSFLALLAERFEETGDCAFSEAYADFRDMYVKPWYGQFASLVERHADAPYYPALARLIGLAAGV